MIHNHTKQKIFNVSTALFSKDGYGNVSMNDIAAQVGISNAAIYRHFDSKESILNSIFEEFDRKLDAYTLKGAQVDVYIQTDTPRELLSRCIVHFGDEDMEFMTNAYRIIYREYMTNRAATELVISALYERPFRSICYVLESLVSRRAIPPVDTRTLSMLWSQCMFSSAAIWVSSFFNGLEIRTPSEEYIAIANRIIEMAVTGNVP